MATTKSDAKAALKALPDCPEIQAFRRKAEDWMELPENHDLRGTKATVSKQVLQTTRRLEIRDGARREA